MKRLGVMLVLSLLALPVSAREYETQVTIESLEDLYELERNGELSSESVRVLEALYQRPMNVNRADRWYLYDLPELSYEMSDAIITRRDEQGGFATLAELSEVEGMTPEVMAAILPFVTVADTGDSPVGATAGISATTKLGTLWRRGFNRNADLIDQRFERSTGPQSYLRFSGTGFTYLGAGGLLTYRRRTDAFWDYSRGLMVSEGPSDRPDLDAFYVFGGYGAVTAILGSYTVGFGESLVFDSTTETHPSGWRENNRLDEDNESGRISPDNGQFGAAVSLAGADLSFGWLDATAFASYDQKDLYQYDFNYGFDPYFGENTCDTDGDCPLGYSCGDDNLCRSTRIYDADDARFAGYLYESHADAFTEQLLGGNVAVNFDERSQVGVTGYTGWTSFNLLKDSEPSFSYSAAYPQKNRFGAVGVNGRWGYDMVDVGAEYAYTPGGGNGAFGRVVLEPMGWMEFVLSGRYYESDFENPYGRGSAARDELHGHRARNERGGKLQATFKPIPRMKLVTKLDAWDNPDLPVFLDDGTLVFERKSRIPVDVDLLQRIEYGVTTKERVALVLAYTNKDIGRNERTEVYSRGDECDEGLDSNCGRGERRKLQVRVSTERVPIAYFWLSYTAAWEDVSKFDRKFDVEQQLRAHARVNAWPGGRVIAHGGFWFHQKEPTAIGSTFRPLTDREEPKVDTYIELQQKLLDDRLTLWARYGVLHYLDERDERFAWYHLGKVAIEGRF